MEPYTVSDNELQPGPAAVVEQPAAPPPTPAEAPEAAAPQPESGDEADEQDEGAEGADEDGKPKRQPSRSQRYREQIARRDQEIADLRRQLASRPPPAAKVQSVEERIGAPPDPRQYQNNAAGYWAAMAGYEARKGFAEQQMKAEQVQAEQAEAFRRQSLQTEYEEKRATGRAEMPDYDQVIAAAPKIPINDELALLIVESDQTARLEYHFAKNPKKLAEINRMSPREAARAIGRLEAQLSNSAPNRSTQAPPPVPPIRGGAAGPKKSLGELPMDEYAKARAAGRVA
jgi:hypothetical protein